MDNSLTANYLMQVTPPNENLNEQVILRCMESILISNMDLSIQQANKYLLAHEDHPQFSLVLLNIFQNSPQNPQLRLMAMAYLRNVIQRYWSKRSYSSKSQANPISEETKKLIREFLVTLAQNDHTKVTRKVVDSCITMVVDSEMPTQFPQIQEFLMSSLSTLYSCLNEGNLAVVTQVETANNLRTCREVLRQLSKKRISNQQPSQAAQSNLQAVYSLWDLVNTHTQQAIASSNSEGFLLLTKFSISLDKMLCFALATQQNDIQTDSGIQEIIKKVVNKIRSVMGVLEQVRSNETMKEILLKQIKTIVLNATQLCVSYPLAFTTALADYLVLLSSVLYSFATLKDENLLKSALLAFYRVAKTHAYYASSEQYSITVTKTKLPAFQPLQSHCQMAFIAHFTNTAIEEMLNHAILQVLPFYFQEAQYAKNDDIIEKEDENFLDDSGNELDNSLYSIAMSMIEQILHRFPEVTLNLLAALFSKLIQTKFNGVTSEVQESIFSIAGIIPKVCEKIQMDPNKVVALNEMLSYLFLNHTTLSFAARRIPILVTRWIKHIPIATAQSEVVDTVCELIFKHPQDPAVRYECCMCLSEIINTEAQLDYSILINRVAPVIVELFASFEVASVLWRLISFLSNILQKCSSTGQNEQLMMVLSNTQLNTILNTDSELLREALVVMFIDLIVYFQPQAQISPLFKLAIQFIDNLLTKTPGEEGALKLWYFIAKEYHPIQNLDEQMKNLLVKHIGALSSSDHDEEAIVKSLSIVEEYILLEFIPLNSAEILGYAEKTYRTAQEFESTGQFESSLDIKTQALNLLGTAILIMLNRREQNIISNLSSIMQLLVVDLANRNFQRDVRSFPTFRSILQTIFNRFLIADFASMLKFVEQCGLSVGEFMQTWILNMEFADSKNSSKINTIAVLTILPHIPAQMFSENFHYMLKRMLPDIHLFIEMRSTGVTSTDKSDHILATRARKDEKVYSARKKLLRKSQLYEDLDLLSFFKTQIQTSFQALGISAENLPLLINDQGRADQFVGIMNL